MLINGVRFCTLFVVAVALYGQPKDVDGWDKIRWGMTMAQVKSTYSVDSQPESQQGWALLKLNPIKLDGVEMGVQAGARDGSQRITMVRLWSYFGLATSPPSAGAQDYDTLRTNLIQKYGDPANEETRHGENFRLIRTVRWAFPSTSIQMTIEQSSSIPNIGNITLDYTATNQ
jgi:hypothetical protein